MLIIAGLLLVALPAHADPISVIAFVATSLVESVWVKVAIVVTASAIGSAQARSKARQAAAAAKAARNAALQDRQATVLSEDPAWRIVYGTAWTGGDIVAIFSSDKPTKDEEGAAYNRPDAYKHLVVIWARHQCQAIVDLQIEGVSLGGIDADGWAQGDAWNTNDTRGTRVFNATGEVRSMTLPAGANIVSVALRTFRNSLPWTVSLPDYAYSISPDGRTITLPGTVWVRGDSQTPDENDTWEITALAALPTGSSCVRVHHHLGADDQAADAFLMSVAGDKWTSAHRLRGCCYSVITLDLEHKQFQGGPPGITAQVQGRLVLDPRTGGTSWSANPALCIYDWLRAEWGYRADAADIDTDSVIAAANACDEVFAVPVTPAAGGSPTTVNIARYTVNGVLSSDQAKEAVLQELCEAMCGYAFPAGAWRLQAGTWSPPVMALTDDDLAGSISVVQAGEAAGDLFNAVHARYVPGDAAIAKDMQPYRNETFIAADGAVLWQAFDLPYTDSEVRARQIARVQTERARNGLIISYPAKLRAWPLQPGNRVSVTSAEYGWSAKYFMVTDWQFGLRSAVQLTLQEDGAAAYDAADATEVDPTPNSNLPNPWERPSLTGVSLDSGTAQLLRQADGTVLSRIRVSWNRPISAFMDSGVIEVRWRSVGRRTWNTVQGAPMDLELFVTGVTDGDVVIVSVAAVNAYGVSSEPVVLQHVVLGKQAPPSTASGFGFTGVLGGALLYWTQCPDADYLDSQLFLGPTLATATLVWQGAANSHTWAQATPGDYRFWLRHQDTSRNFGTPVSLLITVAEIDAAGLTVEYSVDGVTGWHSTYSPGDMYMRQRVGAGSWSAAIRIGGSAGADGSKTATVNLWQWNSGAPAAPTGTSTYTWATAANAGYSAGDGWSVSVPANPGTPGVSLWVASKAITATASALSSSVSWSSGASVYAQSLNGASGLHAARVSVWQWAATIPAGPSGSATYTWATGSFGAAPAGWSLTPGTTPSPGYTLWQASVSLIDNAANATTAFSWTGAGIVSAGYAGANGTDGGPGTAGASARYAYQRVPGNPTPTSGTITTSGSSSFPTSTQSNATWGINQAWVASDPNPSSTNTLYQCDGIYDPATGNTVWTTPYISSLKVGSLSAISANLGSITAGSIDGVTISGGTITGATIQTASSGRRAVLNESSTNTLRLYGDVGAGTEVLAQIGKAGSGAYGSSYSIADFGGSGAIGASICNTAAPAGVFGFVSSGGGSGVRGSALSGAGVHGFATSGNGVFAQSSTGAGLYANGVVSTHAIAAEGAVTVAYGATPEPFGVLSVTLPASASKRTYIGLIRSGQYPWGIGIDSANNLVFGPATSGFNSTITSKVGITTNGDIECLSAMKVGGAFACNGRSPQSSYALPGASGNALIDGIRQALINCGICS
ncbi:hypothetical protein [Roseateles aquae]|uniref:hypothetical protein n=1 Tax=Roseateles aquae TaxID=3077235 RepID=UPI0028E3D2E9|nr:hypothetical protein [Paucibacter sp. APW11]